MKNKLFKAALLVATVATFSSCSSINQSMREPNTRVNFKKSDFTLSAQVTGEAKTTRILGIDWKRLTSQKLGTVEGASVSINLASIPVVGNFIADRTANYALYELMIANPGYDVVFYPQYETKVSKPFLGIGFFKTVTTVKTTARLGKLTD